MVSRKKQIEKLMKILKAKKIWNEATRGMKTAEKKDFAKWLDSLKSEVNTSKRKKG